MGLQSSQSQAVDRMDKLGKALYGLWAAETTDRMIRMGECSRS